MELTDIETLLDAKIDPIRNTMFKLEKQQERIVEIVSNQAVMMNTIKHIEATISKKVEESDKVHDTLFTRLREQDNKISACKEKSGDKLWDIVKLFAAAVLGAIATKIGWR